jgi:predicted GIY-YIG superfamily endonuclease
MFHVHILASETDGNLYTGVTADLDRRFREHQAGKVRSTKGRRPFRLVYTESFATKTAALAREAYFKTPAGGVEKRRLISETADPQSPLV